jgi:hypothetical protein
MVCYAPGTGTLAVIGLAVYVFWHKAILHFFSMAGTAMEITLLLVTGALVAILLIWTARMIRRRQAQAGACTTCRFRCQEALRARPNVLINRVDRRVTPPAVARRAALTCHPAVPLLSRLLNHRARPAVPAAARALRPASAAARPAAQARASAPAAAASPAPRPAPAAPRTPAPAAPRTPAPAAPRTPAPASRATVPARQPWPLAPRPAVRQPARPVETVPFDGYVLTPDGVDGQPAPAAEVPV